VYYLQSHVLRLEAPGACVIWYTAPFLIGMWVGMNPAGWPLAWRRWRWPIVLATLCGLGIYLTVSLARLSTGSYGGPGILRSDSSATPSMFYNVGMVTYATAHV
jgi:hypothetical protein